MTTWKLTLDSPKHEVSDDGQVRTIDYDVAINTKAGQSYIRTIKGRVLNQRFGRASDALGHRKHMYVGMYRGTCRADQRSEDTRVAWLVISAFKGRPWPANEADGWRKWRIRFLDGDVRNCRADNLEWYLFMGTADGTEAANRYAANVAGYEASKGTKPSWMTDYLEDELEGAA